MSSRVAFAAPMVSAALVASVSDQQALPAPQPVFKTRTDSPRWVTKLI